MAQASSAPTPVLPDGYRQIEYIERPSGKGSTAAWNTTGITINHTDNWEFDIGVMAIAQMPQNAGYFIGCISNSSSNIGFGIYMDKTTTLISTWDGVSCIIYPNGNGNSIRNIKYDIVATKSPTGCSITDGINSNAVANASPRSIIGAITLFGSQMYNSTTQVTQPGYGRIYYLTIKKNGVAVCNLIPCVRTSDSKVGMWDTVQETFRTASYNAGPYV